MTWYWWVLVGPALLWLVGYWRRRRHPLTGQAQIRYVWGSTIARWAARLRKSPNNYAVTVGRRTFVRLDYIRQEHAAHEFAHAEQAETLGPTLFVLCALFQYAWFGYAASPMERRAREYALAYQTRFVERRR